MVRFIVEDSGAGSKNLVCNFSGRMDTASCSECENELFEKVTELKAPVIFDMQEVDYVSSAFLRICLKLLKTVGTESFSLVNVHPNVKKVFKIAGFDRQITIS